MSPEQATADKDLTNRSDIYSLGCLLFEMLTGEPPHTGASAQAIVMKIVTDQARPVTDLRASVPPHVAAATHKALEKLPADRFATAAKFSEALGDPGYTYGSHQATVASALDGGRTPAAVWRRLAWPVATIAFALLALWLAIQPGPSSVTARFAGVLPDDAAVFVDGSLPSIAVSPDGTQIVFVGQGPQLYVRELDALAPQPIPGTENASLPFFSPDGAWVGFVANAQLKKISLRGGAPLLITDSIAIPNARGASWGADDVIVFTPTNSMGPSGGLRLVSALGGPVTTLTVPDSTTDVGSHRWPHVLPGAKAAVFSMFMQAGQGQSELGAVSLETGAVKTLSLRGTNPIYLESGHLAYVTQEGTVVAVPFDVDRLEPTGTPVSVLTGVATMVTEAAQIAVSRTGVLVYMSGSGSDAALVMVTRNGVEVPIVSGLRDVGGPQFSPDGRRIAFQALQQDGRDIWVHDIPRGTTERFTFDGDNRYPTWHPDGTSISYSTTNARGATGRPIVSKPVDLTGDPSLVLATSDEQWEHVWTSDGRGLATRVTSVSGATGRDVWYTPLDQPDSARAIVATGFNERAPTLSPDDRWLAYASNATGRDEVYVRPLQGPGTQRQISVGGGNEPAWSPDGGELFYRDGTNMIAVSFTPGPTLTPGAPQVLFRDVYATLTDHANYDVQPTSEQFVMVKGGRTATNLTIVLNWFDEVKELVGN
jgi:serine/threonine-protein kinase